MSVISSAAIPASAFPIRSPVQVDQHHAIVRPLAFVPMICRFVTTIEQVETSCVTSNGLKAYLGQRLQIAGRPHQSSLPVSSQVCLSTHLFGHPRSQYLIHRPVCIATDEVDRGCHLGFDLPRLCISFAVQAGGGNLRTKGDS